MDLWLNNADRKKLNLCLGKHGKTAYC